jgi:hypothetical protein
MLSHTRRVYRLADYTVECRTGGWYYARTSRFGDKEDLHGPYRSITSVTLMIARELTREIKMRDAPHTKEVAGASGSR